MVQAVEMLSSWHGPDWSELKVGKESNGSLNAVPIGPPPTILIRATENSFLESQQSHLGWDEYKQDFFKRIIRVPGNHFTMFTDDHVAYVADALHEACQLLERLTAVVPSNAS
ncbi:hypothetical protein COCSADRAFT_42123 [Bipolaris sorokiniana ND90Pr]|uniref:Thioesterase domain-containing protein n=1 Tax=Cochliobolus sativus (strain ND90Pr / ATCC 201652) TaxID=665912 RepID=M2S6T9_COCSN|nr:uncharacterized protein COCSADRAFT_42123 [Bipolaris sorokiniana ND90Pr]EMD58080.1 hypothetical protein COCSADRAFT_42123 [Bipolaris sorokiniana ND90Pr]